MIIDHYIEQEQESRQLEALNAVEIELDKNTDIYGAGELDAIIGKQPDPKLSANRFFIVKETRIIFGNSTIRNTGLN